jgi:hypothetical protein
MKTSDHYKLVMTRLKKSGFLLESDPKLPSVCTLITGEPLKSSWWSHPLAQTIFAVNERLEDDPDVLITKLVSEKVTFVHRKLWPGLLAIGTAREPWQLEGLSSSAQALLKLVEAKGTLTTENLDLPKLKTSSARKPGDAARELERRLLVHAEQFHTEGGKHAKRLETWQHWSKRTDVDTAGVTAAEAKLELENTLQKLNHEFGAKGQLPWMKLGKHV